MAPKSYCTLLLHFMLVFCSLESLTEFDSYKNSYFSRPESVDDRFDPPYLPTASRRLA